MLRKLKNIFLPPAIIIAILSFSLSCENPFVPNLGAKVDITPPLVKVNSPVAGGYIKGNALFKGTAWAYRSLKRVEYKIFANEKNNERGRGWTEVRYSDTGSKERGWYLDLPTQELNGGDDGSITLQFRAIDDSQSGETVPFVYFIKNKPSEIIMSRPADDLTNANTEPKLLYGTDITGQITDIKGLKPGFPQIKIWKADRPGGEPDRNDNYTLSDADLEEGLGWASLFLPGVGSRSVGFDDLEGKDLSGNALSPPVGSYADRTKMAPVVTAQFALRLDKFKIVPDPANPDIRRIEYEIDPPITGTRVHMDPGDLYYFKIRTSDTNTYDDESDAATYKRPIAYSDPLDPLYNSGTMVGHFPPLNFGEQSVNPFIPRRDPIKLRISSEAVPPVIELDNTDVSSVDPDWNKRKPHIYIDEATVKKIAAVDPALPPATPPLFRLRIKGMHTDGISHAILEYTHDATGRGGFLKWDNDEPGSQGYVNASNPAELGHRGVPDPLDSQHSTHFTFTATPENQMDLVTTQPIFTTSSGPYILSVTVYAGSDAYSTARYAVYMDGNGPVVSIPEIVGASAEPVDIPGTAQTALNGFANAAGGVINGSPYTVNNNIQVVVTRSDENGIMQNVNTGGTPPWITPAPGRPPADVLALSMVKWVVDVAPDNDLDGSIYFNTPNTVYQKILAFRTNPIPDNLDFFNEITDATVAPAKSGWVNPPKSAGKPADLRNHFKFNTNHTEFNDKDLWVYVIAQDTMQNLGFIMQKIHVDQDSDKPVLNVDALSIKNANNEDINDPIDLNVNFVSRASNGEITWSGNFNNGFKNNILEENQYIDMNFTDYDGIRLDDIIITITDLNGRSLPAERITAADILKDGNKNNWSGVLTQSVMATALYRTLPAAQRPNPMHLFDGMYQIVITYKDDITEKVVIEAADRPGGVAQPGDNPPEAAGARTYIFAVNAEPERPEIWVAMAENEKQSEEPVTVWGWVRSRLKVQRLFITFTPDVITPLPDYNSSRTVEIPELYPPINHPNDQYPFDTAVPIPQAQWLGNEAVRGADGYYTYYWKMGVDVVFQPSFSYGVDQDSRRFTLEAYDRLGNSNTYTRTVLVDATPPEVNIVFNYGRTDDVNGKVPFSVTATDNNKLAEETSDRPGDTASGKWWVLPATAAVPEWGTAFPSGTATVGGSPLGMGGWFYNSEDLTGGGRFTKVINTLYLTDGSSYKLYVIFRDNAGNTGYAPPRVPPEDIEFRVDQETDYPTINTDNLRPALDTFVKVKELIRIYGGTASDDDGFNRTDLNKLPAKSVVGGNGYVQIRFPATWDINGTPTSWGQWISVPGTFNSEGAIRFDFKVTDFIPDGADEDEINEVITTVFNEYFDTDGAKHYQIKITDEAVAGTLDRPPGKNPDGVTTGSYPAYLGPVFKIFPGGSKTEPYTGFDETYYFVLDDKPPEIFFDKYDPTEGHPDYNPIRPAYSSFADLAADLKGHVEENNFETLSIIWDGARQLIRNKNSPFRLEAGKRLYDWNINVNDPATGNATAEIKAVFEEKFRTAAQGLHTITLDATDTAGNPARVAWMFYKDTQGPNILVNTIRRVISHNPPITAPGAFPDNWPSDWPYGTAWKDDPNWTTFRSDYGVDNWASEFAYYTGTTVTDKAAKVITSLKSENAIEFAPDGKEVSVISGSEDQVYIGGSFSDDLSDIWESDDHTTHFFWYRFDRPGRDINTDPSVTTGWTRGNFEPMTPGNTRSADWKISIPPESTPFADGEHTFDIKVADKAGNWSDIYSLRFIVDRNNPVLLGYNDEGTAVSTTADVPQSFRVRGGGANNRPLHEEAQRVFSAAGAGPAENTVFSLEGFVRDNNLSDLLVVITTEGGGTTPYRVESGLTNIAVWATGGASVTSVDTDLSTGGRLVLTRSITTPNEWLWTFNVLEKDVAALRAQGTDATRRYINVTAIDKARRRVGPQRWNFYLDSKKPVIEYTNIEKGPNFTLNPGGDTIILQGIASDDTKIKDVKYSLAKWDYVNNRWTWATTADWTLTTQPPVTEWVSMLDPNYGAVNALSTLNWTLNNTKLNESGKYPQNIFLGEGQFKLDLLVTDWSLSSDSNLVGNPHNTTANPDPNYGDAGYYDPVTNTYPGNASARKFFIDRTDPIITDKDNNKIYYRNDNSIFEFEAFDGNTITKITARIKDTKGNSFEIDPDLITYSRIGTTEWNYNVEIKPPMGTGDFDLEAGNYTLEITAIDGAGRETYATKAFYLDNEAPVLNFVSPSDGSVTKETVTGRVVIRGNTTENSNLIKKVAFYIANENHGWTDPTTTDRAYVSDVPSSYTGTADDYNYGNGWHFYQDFVTPPPNEIRYTNPPPATGGGVLIFIEPGTFTWEIRIPNSRNFSVSTQKDDYVEWTYTGTAAGQVSGLTYNGATIPDVERVGKMRLFIAAEDEAGNVSMVERTFWIYPEGDRPTVSFSNPDDKKIEAERLMNGRIRVAGMARDNERVKYVWFRVRRTNANGTLGDPYTNLSIYSWYIDPLTGEWEIATDAQLNAGVNVIDNRNLPGSASQITLRDEDNNDLGVGWYRANGGGSPNVSWWTYINMEGELEPQGNEGRNRITIEARAEDTTRGDTDDWVALNVKGMFSRDKGDPDATPPRPKPTDNIGHTVTALVVQGAPIFGDEEVRIGVSWDTSPPTPANTNPWGSISSYSLSKRASYRIVVKNDSGVGAIRWSRTRWNGTALEPLGMVDLLDPTNPYNTRTGTGDDTYAGHLLRMDNGTLYNADTNPGIAVKADPHPDRLKTSASGTLPAGTYLIWEKGTGNPGYLGFLTEGDDSNARYTTFTAATGFTITSGSGAQIIERDADGNFEWLVTVDVNTVLLDNGTYKYDPDKPFEPANPTKYPYSFRYPLTLSATDISKATPLTSSNTSYLPIDNLPPNGIYTLNTKPAGLAAVVGGESGDLGPVNGIAKVVIWFSRLNQTNGDGISQGISWHELGIRNIQGDDTSGWKPGLGPLTGWQSDTEPITVTKIGPTGQPVQDDNFIMPYIPQPNSSGVHSATGGDYAIVIDRNDPSGVQEKWGQKMPVGLSTGGIGKIWYAEINSFGITSGPVYIHYVVFDTAGNASYYKERLVIMNNAPQIKQIKLGTDIRDNSTLRSGTNESLATGTYTTGPSVKETDTLLGKIRTAVPLRVGDDPWETNDVARGITDWISAIRTSENGTVRQISDFTARNKLLALRVETTEAPAAEKSRRFRFEYVSGAEKLEKTVNNTSRTLANGIKAGRVYVIDEPGNARWGAVGAPEVAFTRGLAFMASLNGIDGDTNLARGELDAVGTFGSVWELNSAYGDTRPITNPSNLAIGDANYVAPAPGSGARNNDATNAEFVYKAGAFGSTRGSYIVDYNPAVSLAQPNVDPSTTNTLFILKIFDGDESDQFADFALLSFRVNDNDKTRPSSQLYDLNPKTEGQDQPQTVQRSLSPMFVGNLPAANSNRTKGGLWNTDTSQLNLVKPGHIEPRKTTSLTSAEMGGARTLALNTVDQPYANPLAYYNIDTVSGRVVLRGYAEDDQRVNRIDLIFTDNANAGNNRTVTILDRSVVSPAAPPNASAGNVGQYVPATTGLLRVAADSNANPTTGRVYYTDTIDLYKHRVEWAYIWDTETLPANMVVGDAFVRAVVYNENNTPGEANADSAVKASENILAPGQMTGTLNNYNRIQINIRPYITGFMRNQSQFLHNTRSRQGWFPFSREEVVVAKGYNIGRTGLNTTISLPSAANLAANAVTDDHRNNYGLDSTNVSRYRYFTVTNNAAPGVVTLMVGTYQAVNNYTNGNDRPRLNVAGTAVDNNGRFWVQPWNTEYSQGTAGSELWDDFTSVHIWQSTNVANNTAAGADQGAFPTRRENWTYMYPSMSIDPSNGALYASMNEGGSGASQNTGNTMISNNYSAWSAGTRNNVTVVASFVDPIYYSDIYFPPSGNATPAAAATANATAFSSYSIFGRSGNYEFWTVLGGVYTAGPGGANPNLSNGAGLANQYHAESTWYNACTQSPTGPTNSNPQYTPQTDQFLNTHIITTTIGGNTHIHTSYYDTKDGSLHYRYNLRGSVNNTLGSAASVTGSNNQNTNANGYTPTQSSNAVSKQWTNLDGGYDADDTAATNFVNNNVSNLAGAGTNVAIAANTRVVNQASRPAAVAERIDAGEHNAIALTSQGYPVVAYFDTTNQKLKLAVSNRVAPVLASSWTIRDDVIPIGNRSRNAGEYISIAINTVAGNGLYQEQNRIHMAALDPVNKNLVYITGIVNPTATGAGALTGVEVRVVDHIGSVGRWCDISLDSDGNPWISYQDESYRGSMDGVRMAFLNRTTFPKALADAYGEPLSGWETMNVPARYRVEDARISIENFPARNNAPANNTARDAKFWRAAVAYPAPDFFRIAYYVKN